MAPEQRQNLSGQNRAERRQHQTARLRGGRSDLLETDLGAGEVIRLARARIGRFSAQALKRAPRRAGPFRDRFARASAFAATACRDQTTDTGQQQQSGGGQRNRSHFGDFDGQNIEVV